MKLKWVSHTSSKSPAIVTPSFFHFAYRAKTHKPIMFIDRGEKKRYLWCERCVHSLSFFVNDNFITHTYRRWHGPTDDRAREREREVDSMNEWKKVGNLWRWFEYGLWFFFLRQFLNNFKVNVYLSVLDLSERERKIQNWNRWKRKLHYTSLYKCARDREEEMTRNQSIVRVWFIIMQCVVHMKRVNNKFIILS